MVCGEAYYEDTMSSGDSVMSSEVYHAGTYVMCYYVDEVVTLSESTFSASTCS